MRADLGGVRVLVFDVFGTLADLARSVEAD